MRLASLSCAVLALAGISAAQDTNFPAGPQYLITGGSSMFLHSIATPTLSLSAPIASPVSPANDALPQAAPVAGLPSPDDLARIYWRGPETGDKVAGNVSENVAEDASRGLSEKVSEDATKNAGEIEITEAPSSAVPSGILDTGVTGMTSPQSLRVRGFGVPLGTAASYWKAHKPHASRVYTNADIQRLRPS